MAALLTVPLLASCVNPAVVNKTGGNFYPLAPGDQPFVLLTILNNTQAVLDIPITVDEGRSTPTSHSFRNFDPRSKTDGILIPYPFLRVSVGPLDDPFAPSINGTLPDGLTVRVPFGRAALVAGQDFKKGDTIIFDFVADARSPAAISVSTGIVDGSTQTGPFSRADTFQTVTALLLLNGIGTNAAAVAP